MPRRFYSGAMEHQNRQADRADRSSNGGRHRGDAAPRGDDDGDLLPAMTPDERDRYVQQYGPETMHTGTIVDCRASGWVVRFGRIEGILPFDKTAGAGLKNNDRTSVYVVSFDGTRAPLLERRR